VTIRDVRSLNSGLSIIHTPPQPGFPAPDPGDKKFNSRLVAPITLQWHSTHVVVVLTGAGEECSSRLLLPRPKIFRASLGEFRATDG
jgi:hypothetical protein